MTTTQFTEFAREQVTAAEQILRQHHPAGAGCCSCGRPEPCPQAAPVRTHCDHFRERMALLEATVVLPVVAG